MTSHTFAIRQTTPADWRNLRSIRLEMIQDTPTAYAETFDEASALDEAAWRTRGERGSAEHATQIVAISDDGRWLGSMGGYLPDTQTGPLLVGVYVTPEWRGRDRGLTDALFERLEEWARTEGSTLTLHVHEENLRARKYYERQGFVATGQSVPYNLDPTKNELEMMKQLVG